MEIAEVKKVKLNVTNIKSVLIRSNKKFRNVEQKKSYLTRRQEEQEKRILLEKKIEGSPSRKIPKIPLLGKAAGVARSIWDRLVNFFGWLLAGFLVTRLPQIIENLKTRFAFIKPIWEGAMKTFAIIGKGMSWLFNGISSLFNLNKSTKDLQKAESDLKNLDKDLKGMNHELKGGGTQARERTSSDSSTNVNDNNSQFSSVNYNQGPFIDNNLESTGQVMRQALLKEDNKIQTKSKKIKEKKHREVKNPRLDSRLDRNVKVRTKTASSVLNQKGPLDKDQHIPADLIVVERTKVKWWNPATWSRASNNNSNVSEFLDNGVQDLG
tara:strand:+ start:6072 stop:7043 length:972 start_codon:yes stop_codon:yes gene_type:complete